jgi:hypothetical protein
MVGFLLMSWWDFILQENQVGCFHVGLVKGLRKFTLLIVVRICIASPYLVNIFTALVIILGDKGFFPL